MPGPTDEAQSAVAKMALQAGEIGAVVERHQGVGGFRGSGMDDGAIVATGQNGQRALQGETLPGRPPWPVAGVATLMTACWA